MKKIMLSALLLMFASAAFSQKRNPTTEFGLFLGGSYYIGDLNPTRHFVLTQPAGGVVFRYNMNPRVGFKGNVLFGTIEGNDAISDVLSQRQRNLQFKSSIVEVAGEVEFNFLNYVMGDDRTPFTPYIFIGLAVYHFNPQAQVGNAWMSLQPLSTEGQETSIYPNKKRYLLTQVSIPFGVGIKLSIAQRVGISVEWGMRKTFTDYLDDVSTSYADPAVLLAERGVNAAYLADRSTDNDPQSHIGKQRGDSSTKDWYSFAGIILSLKLKKKTGHCPGTY